ncbi:MAG: hypothetical protein ACK6C0_03110 [Betaproteobacteria bacterium]
MGEKHDHLFKREAVEWRVWVGLASICAGVTTMPLGFWFAGHAVTATGCLLFFAGAALFATERQFQRVLRTEREANVHSRHPGLVGGDVHNHSGWLSGWRKSGPTIEASDPSGGGGETSGGD